MFFKWLFKFVMAVMVHVQYIDSKNGLVLCVCVLMIGFIELLFSFWVVDVCFLMCTLSI